MPTLTANSPEVHTQQRGFLCPGFGARTVARGNFFRVQSQVGERHDLVVASVVEEERRAGIIVEHDDSILTVPTAAVEATRSRPTPSDVFFPR